MDYAREGTIFAVALAGSATQHALLRSNLLSKAVPLSDAQAKEKAEANCIEGKGYAQCIQEETAFQKSLAVRSPTLSTLKMVGFNATSVGTIFLPLFVAYMSYDFAAKKSAKTATISAAVFATIMLVIFNVIAGTKTAPGIGGSIIKSLVFAVAAAAVSALMHEMWKKK